MKTAGNIPPRSPRDRAGRRRHTKVAFSTVTTSLPLLKTGMIRPLAVTGQKRHAQLPDVPTFSEVGLLAVSVINWAGMTAPPNVPPHIVAVWEKAMQEMTSNPQVIAKMKNVGLEPLYLDSKESKARVAKEIEEFQRLTK